MKKILFTLICLLNISTSYAKNTLSPTQQANEIYDNCQSNYTIVQNTTALEGNISDVERERDIQKCLTDNIITLAKKVIKPDEIENFKASLTNLEQSTFDVYRFLIFCPKDIDKNWCYENYKNDTSLGKLLLEKSITSQLYNTLKNIIEAEQGSFEF